MLIWYFSNNLYVYDYVGKLQEQNFSVWLFSNQGIYFFFLLKFNESRISEWNVLKDGIQHPVLAQTFEAQMTGLTSSLDGQDREDFIAHCPNMREMERSIFRYSQNQNLIGLKLAWTFYPFFQVSCWGSTRHTCNTSWNRTGHQLSK